MMASDYLATHAALITIGISLAIKYELDIGYRVTPPRFGIARVLPRFILIAALRAFFKSKWAKLDLPDKNSDWRNSAMYLE